jgi:hypothetical protein
MKRTFLGSSQSGQVHGSEKAFLEAFGEWMESFPNHSRLPKCRLSTKVTHENGKVTARVTASARHGSRYEQIRSWQSESTEEEVVIRAAAIAVEALYASIPGLDNNPHFVIADQ